MNDMHVFDEIDTIVDKVVENPSKAAKLKEALHTKGLASRLSRPDVVRMRSSYDDSGDDLWDNVPV